MNDLDRYLPGIVAGDATAFARWVAGAESRVRLSLARFADRVDTEVVVQETLLRIWQVAPRVEVDGRGDSLLRLSIRMARNIAIDQVRARHQLAATDAIEDDIPIVEAGVEPDPLLRRALAECREALPPRPREAFDLRLSARGCRSDDELAATIAMKTNTFLQNFGRARKLLADCLKQKGIDLLLEWT